MKTVLLTGAGGSIGCHTLIHILHNTDWDVVCIDSFRHKGLQDRIVEVLRDHRDYHHRVRIVTHDLIAPLSELEKEKIGKVDYIINMASLSDVEASIQDPVMFIKNNVDLTINMLEYACEAKPEAFIQISTDEVYGPVPNKNEGFVEWSPLIPSNPYAASKAMQEMAAISYWRTYDVPVIITNTMNNFGEMQQSSKFPVMIQKWIAAGKKVTIHGNNGDIGSRSYIHSRNHADALVFILKNLPAHHHVANEVDRPDRYNIAGDKQLDNLELAQLIAKLMGIETLDYELVDTHTTRPGHDKHYGLNAEKIKKLGWESPVSFEESLKNTIEWQITNNEWIK